VKEEDIGLRAAAEMEADADGDAVLYGYQDVLRARELRLGRG